MNKNGFRWMAVVAALACMTACNLKEDVYEYDMVRPSAIVTVKPDAENASFYMQLDDEKVLYPVNLRNSPFGTKEVRALVNYRKPTASEIQQGGLFDDAVNVYVNWMDSILTKNTVPDLGELNASTYGDDPLSVYGDWCTVVEDGYLTLHFGTYWVAGSQHRINLVTGSDPDDPYKVVLYHDAGGSSFGEAGDALVAFSLAALPDTGGQTVTLTLQWRSFSGGTYSATFPYRSRPAL